MSLSQNRHWHEQQECIPVGCVPPAAVAVRRGSPPGSPPGSRHPPVDRHTPVNILPCPKLRLWAVKILLFVYQIATNK